MSLAEMLEMAMSKLLRRYVLLLGILGATMAPLAMHANDSCGCQEVDTGWFCCGDCDKQCSGGACVETCDSCCPPLPN
jgi:hypothetical protein